MKFKVGDRVKYTSGSHSDSEYNPLWGGSHGQVEGEIINDNYNSTNDYCYRVKWDNGRTNSYRIKDVELIRSHCIVPEELFKI